MKYLLWIGFLLFTSSWWVMWCNGSMNILAGLMFWVGLLMMLGFVILDGIDKLADEDEL